MDIYIYIHVTCICHYMSIYIYIHIHMHTRMHIFNYVSALAKAFEYGQSPQRLQAQSSPAMAAGGYRSQLVSLILVQCYRYKTYGAFLKW